MQVMPYPVPPLGHRPDTPLNPDRAYLLEFVRMQKDFVRGEGSWLYDDEGQAYLDLAAQYGAVPLGYNPSELWEEIERCRRERTPIMVQPAVSEAAYELAERLIELAPGDLKYVTFCSSGAEAIEVAIKLARVRTGRTGILSVAGGFHGKTMGALSATACPYFQTPFQLPLPGFWHVPFGDLNALEEWLKKRGSEVAAFLVETVQGEGGMRAVPPGYLASAEQLCRQHGVLLVVDEIQTGLGRTGSLFACEQERIRPDMLLLAKALGGGMMPLGACLCTAQVWDQRFGMLHSSTFANNALACRVGQAVLNRVSHLGFLAEVQQKAGRLKEGLGRIQELYPDVIAPITGRGLMLGLTLEASTYTGDDSFVMAALKREGTLAPFLCAHLANVWQIWTAPLLSRENILRIEPALTINDAEIEHALAGIEGMADTLHRRDFASIFRFLLNKDQKPNPRRSFGPLLPPQPATPRQTGEKRNRFAFFVHYPSVRELRLSDPSFADATDEELAMWLQKTETYARPHVVYHLPCIRSATGVTAEGWLIALGLLPQQLLRLGRRRIDKLMHEGLQQAKALDVDMFGLGAFTAIATRAGQKLVDKGVPITTGNSLAVAMAMEGVLYACRQMDIALDEVRACVIGAPGSIGGLCSLLLAQKVHDITLIGNPARADRMAGLRRIAGQIYRRALQQREGGVGARLDREVGDLLTTDCSAFSEPLQKARQSVESALQRPANTETDAVLSEAVEALYRAQDPKRSAPICYEFDISRVVPFCDVVVSASSSTTPLIHAPDLRPGAIVCDVALPPDVSASVRSSRPDVLTFDGGLVHYPDPKVAVGFNFGYPPGYGLACLAETMVLALEGDRRDHSIGRDIPIDEVTSILELAQKHGFGFGGLRSGGKEITTQDIERVRKAAIRTQQAPMTEKEDTQGPLPVPSASREQVRTSGRRRSSEGTLAEERRTD